jgi:hypothetical protein
MGVLLKNPQLREAFQKVHPLGDRVKQSETAAFWMILIGGLWSLQEWLQ